jgi:VIT1/CCC1 family predicted Fe2+/Mn2+ transporter
LVESPPAGNGDAQNPFKEGSNPFKDVQNILGFLLAGFGGIISFLGLQSAEVTTVLRNDPAQASVVAAILTLGMLAAVLTVVINGEVAHHVASAGSGGRQESGLPPWRMATIRHPPASRHPCGRACLARR